ncbi:hypothetical protein L1987_04920 [Smallanthus sonchifolius]|uniref:Uncharacterized protein n=1 Tax=Smallanthus sonchifolius TaxID=185202 RepID=A0ACB9JTX0_9ASTR|nr:hypothetical protein L1987_04920 [Smallanthus sonchifolius]
MVCNRRLTFCGGSMSTETMEQDSNGRHMNVRAKYKQIATQWNFSRIEVTIQKLCLRLHRSFVKFQFCRFLDCILMNLLSTSLPHASTFKSPKSLIDEMTLAQLRHPDYCISGYSSRSVEEGEKCFNRLSIEGRGKFDEETLVNVNNIRKQSAMSKRSNGFCNEYIVIYNHRGR